MKTIASSPKRQALFPIPNEYLPQMNTSLSRPQIADKTSEPEKKDAKEPMTITKDFTTKHPLQNSWTLWYDNSTNAKNDQDWEQSLKPVYTLSTVEDFWW
jgi:hypothetical protein